MQIPDSMKDTRAGDPQQGFPERRANDRSHRRLMVGLTALAFVWRMYFVVRAPFYTPDSWGYDHIAQNWLAYHVFGLEVNGRLTPLDFRLPGYPGFLALIYALVGISRRTVMVTQAALDTLTCLLAGRIARSVAPRDYAIQAEAWTLGIAAVCPFLPCYAAAVLSEVPTTFLLTAAMLVAISAFRGENKWAWMGAGGLTGLAILFRPESGLLAGPIGIALLLRYHARSEWPRLVRAGLVFSLGLGLTLIPWTVRNAITMHEFQPLSPRYANSPGEYVPAGYCRWVRTWLVSMVDVDEAFWKLNEQPIFVAKLPDRTFDSPAERARVAALLDRYNRTTEITPDEDQGFAQIASERIARHPVRYYLTAPAHRAMTMWFTPRVETLAYSGDVWPPLELLEDDWRDFLVSSSLGGMNVILIGLAGLGLFAWRKQLAYADLLLAWILLRTAYLTTVETPEPRYVLECYPALFAFAALGVIAIGRRFHIASKP
jgi:4-amino-4-deoxy-L-arabinose transferase-like glycosyltransferase